uniref:sugar porter family MFS transporter n=1 Tax=Saccharopolyspora galaxeae TaxID=2781241 RepID=UPI0021071C1A|nr:sugar porter family MFS transporter [Saccharopolyspora sp. HNM0986]
MGSCGAPSRLPATSCWPGTCRNSSPRPPATDAFPPVPRRVGAPDLSERTARSTNLVGPTVRSLRENPLGWARRGRVGATSAVGGSHRVRLAGTVGARLRLRSGSGPSRALRLRSRPAVGRPPRAARHERKAQHMSTPATHPGAGRGTIIGASTIAALGGLLFGYDTGVISAALLYIAPAFGLSTGMKEVVVASLLLGAVAGAMSGGPVVDRLGRKRTLLLVSAVFTAGALLSAVAVDVAMLIVARVVLGLAIGASSLVVPAYIAEIAPPALRGRLVSMNQLMITIGIFVSYLVGYAFAEMQGWRWMLGLAAVPSLAMLIGLLFLGESPRWLLARGRTDEARAELLRTRSAQEVDAEIDEITVAMREESKFSYRDLFRPGLRPAVLLGFAVAATNQLVGVNAVIYYAPTILQQAGLGASASILSSVGIGAVNMVFTAIALLMIDRVGRRPLLIGGTSVVIVVLFGLGALYLLPSVQGLGLWLTGGLMLYEAAFAASLGLAIWLINSEVFPTAVRGKASSVGTVTHWALDFLISISVLTLISALTETGLFWIYGVLGIIGLTYLYRNLPETKGRSLEDIERSLRKQR